MRNNTEQAKLIYEGKHFITNSGREIVILKYISYQNVLIEFLCSGFKTFTNIYSIEHGTIEYPFEKSFVAFTDNKYKFEGSYFKTNKGYIVKVLAYNSISDIDIVFLCDGYKTKVTAQNLEKGQISHPFEPNNLGGYRGVETYRMNVKQDKRYFKWKRILSKNICENWKCFDNFYNWINQFPIIYSGLEYKINCSIFRTNNEGLYSPETCIVVPADMDRLITKGNARNKYYNIYRDQIINLAEMYYSNNIIDQYTYNTCINNI